MGYRSCGYAKELSAQQFDAYNMRGSIVAWVSGPCTTCDCRCKQ